MPLPIRAASFGSAAVVPPSKFFSRGWKGWLWPVLLGATIVFASSRSGVEGPEIEGIDKVAHFFLFGLLASLVVRNGFLPGYGWLAVVCVSAFGITDEWHQNFTPGRSVEVADWIADTLGALVAVTLYARWTAYRSLLERSLNSAPETRVEKSATMLPNAAANEPRTSPETHR